MAEGADPKQLAALQLEQVSEQVTLPLYLFVLTMYYTYFVLTMYLLFTVGGVHGLHGGPRQEPAARALRARRRPGGHPVRVRGDNQRRSSPSLSSVHASLSSIVRLPSPFLSCSLSYLNGSAIVPSSFSLSLLRTHQLSFGLGARPCQTSAAQHIPCVGCCRMARLYIHTMRRLFVAVCSYAALAFFLVATRPRAQKMRNCSTSARPGALVVALAPCLALPAVRLALGAAGASKVVLVALGICARTPPRLVHAVSRVVAEVAARSGARSALGPRAACSPRRPTGGGSRLLPPSPRQWRRMS